MAPGYGSYLLPLRLPFLYSQAIRFSVRPKQEVLSDLASRTLSPFQPAPFVFRVRIETFRRGCLARPCCNVLVPVAILTRRSLDSSPGSKSSNPGSVTRIAGDFCVPALRLTPHSQLRPGATPSAEAGEICLRYHRLRATTEGARLPAVPDFSAVAGIISECALRPEVNQNLRAHSQSFKEHDYRIPDSGKGSITK